MKAYSAVVSDCQVKKIPKVSYQNVPLFQKAMCPTRLQDVQKLGAGVSEVFPKDVRDAVDLHLRQAAFAEVN